MDDLMTAAEVAEMIGVKPRTWHAYAARGDAGAPQPARRIGRTPLWDRGEVEAWHRTRQHQTYFLAKARHVLREAGGDPDRADALAEWAKSAKEVGDPRVGVIVAADGSILAETRRSEGRVAADYVTTGPHAKLELGLAMGEYRREYQVIHVRYGQVCSGQRPTEAL